MKPIFIICCVFMLQNGFSQTYSKPVSLEDSLTSMSHGRKAHNYLYKLEDYKKAILECDTAIKFNPKIYYFHSLKAICYERLKDYASALLEYNESIKLNSFEIATFIDRSSLLIKMKNYQEAYEGLIKAKSIDSLNPYIYIYMGLLQKEQSQLKLACANYDRAIMLKNNISLAYKYRSEAYYVLNKDSLAFIDVEKGIALKPSNMASYFYLAVKICLRSHRFQDLIKYGNSYLQLKPNDYFVQLALTEACYQLGNNQEAITITNAVESQPSFKNEKENYKLYYFRAAAKLELNDYKGADEDANTGIKLTPLSNQDELVGFYAIRMQTAGRFGRYKEARNDAEAVIKRLPDNGMAYLAIGSIDLKNRNFQNAIDNLSKAIEFAPENATSYILRGDAEFALKQYENSKSDLLKGFNMPNNTIRDKAFIGLTLIYEHEKDYKKALSYATQGIQEFPKSTNLYSARARIYYVMNYKEAACRDLKAAKELGGKEEADEYAKFCK